MDIVFYQIDRNLRNNGSSIAGFKDDWKKRQQKYYADRIGRNDCYNMSFA